MSRTDLSLLQTTPGTYTRTFVSWNARGQITHNFVSQFVSGTAASLSCSRAGTVTSGYGKHSKPTPLPHNGFSFTEDSFQDIVGSVSDLTYSADGSRYGFMTTGVITLGTGSSASFYDLSNKVAALRSAVVSKATSKVLGNLKADGANFAIMAAELPQTIELIRTTFMRLAEARRALVTGDFTGFCRSLGIQGSRRSKARFESMFSKDKWRAIADAWIEYIYGWKPLLQDVYDAIKFFESKDKMSMWSTTRAVSTATDNTSKTVSFGYDGLMAAQVNQQLSVSCRIQLEWAETPGAQKARLAALVGLTNPASVAWEKLPWSFVVDWALPIGAWLNSLDATVGLTFLQGSSTVFVKHQGTAEGIPSGKHGANQIIKVSGRGFKRYTNCVRTKLTSFPTPVLPVFKSPVSLIHAINAIALLAQQTLKSDRRH